MHCAISLKKRFIQTPLMHRLRIIHACGLEYSLLNDSVGIC